jgi:hypothetical protein
MLGPEAVADVGIAELEVGVLVDELAVDAVGLDDVVRDVVEDRQVGLRRERELDVGQLVGAVLERRQHCHLDVLPLRRRSVTRVQRTGCISAMFEPQSTNASAASMSS